MKIKDSACAGLVIVRRQIAMLNLGVTRRKEVIAADYLALWTGEKRVKALARVPLLSLLDLAQYGYLELTQSNFIGS